MPLVILPPTDQLVKELTDMLMVLNQPDKRTERWKVRSIDCRGRQWIPKAQLEERARNIAQMFILAPPAGSGP